MTQDYRNIIIKSFVFLILLPIIGLPINDFIGFYLLLLVSPIIIFSNVLVSKKLIYFFLAIFIFLIIKSYIPGVRIHEGHNIVILNQESTDFYKKNLPRNVYNFFEKQYNYYSGKNDCDSNNEKCWVNFSPYRTYSGSNINNTIYAFSSDWSIDQIKYSRIVDDINFMNLKQAKLGIINNLTYNYFWPKKNDLVRETLPFFVMYEISNDIINSNFCWKGNIYWEQYSNNFQHIFHEKYRCKKLTSNDIGKKIYGVSAGLNADIDDLKYLYGENFISSQNNDFINFLEKNELNIKLEKNFNLTVFQYLKIIISTLLCFATLFIFFKFDRKIYLATFSYSILFIILLNYINVNLIQGFDIYTGGNDGLVYMSFGNILFKNLISFNLFEYFRGVENVFYFPSYGLRFFWSINKIFFGETIYGYIFIGYIYLFLLFLIFKELFSSTWSLIIIFFVFLTRIFEGYALSQYKFINQIHAGDSEPLAIFFSFLSLILFIKIIKDEKYRKSLYYFLFGFFIFISISFRPNYLPCGIVLISSLLFYNFYYLRNIKFSIISVIGFSFFLSIPLHNFVYGNAYVLLSTGVPHNYNVPLDVYYYALIDVFRFNFSSSENISLIVNQLIKWIKPGEIHYIISIIIIFISLIQKNSFIIKTIIFMALSQHAVLLIFEPSGRYAYFAWILTIIILMHFLINYFGKLNFLKNYFKKSSTST